MRLLLRVGAPGRRRTGSTVVGVGRQGAHECDLCNGDAMWYPGARRLPIAEKAAIGRWTTPKRRCAAPRSAAVAAASPFWS